MPYNDAHGDAFGVRQPELRQFNALPEPVAQRVATINDAVNYITKLSDVYVEQISPVNNIIAVAQNLEKKFDLESARHNLEGLYEGI